MKRKRGVIYKAGPSNLAMFFLPLVLLSWVMTIALSGYPVAAWAYYKVVPATSSKLAQILADVRLYKQIAPEDDQVDGGEGMRKKVNSLPPTDESLEDVHWLSIPSIRVDTGILEGGYEDYEQIFRKGVWRVPDFADPETSHEKPMILVAHRFGYLEWTNEYRRYNSFFNLPKIQVGDEVEVLWEQRKYVYRVGRIVEAEEIDDYSGDLILYTCKFLVSDVKIFVYANRVN